MESKAAIWSTDAPERPRRGGEVGEKRRGGEGAGSARMRGTVGGRLWKTKKKDQQYFMYQLGVSQ